MRYNAIELYIIPSGSFKLMPRIDSEGNLYIPFSGNFNHEGLELKIYHGILNFSADGPDSVIASDTWVYKDKSTNRSGDTLMCLRKKVISYPSDQQRSAEKMIRDGLWGIIKDAGGIDAFRRKMVGIYMAEFVRDLERLQAFIERCRTDLFSAMESQTEKQLLQVAINYYDTVDPEEDSEDD